MNFDPPQEDREDLNSLPFAKPEITETTVIHDGKRHTSPQLP
jgi:hypothetical protein